MKKMTADEKLLFFRGYLHAKAEEFAKEFGYTTEEAKKMILEEFIKRSY